VRGGWEGEGGGGGGGGGGVKPQEPEACFGEKRNVCRVLGEELK